MKLCKIWRAHTPVAAVSNCCRHHNFLFDNVGGNKNDSEKGNAKTRSKLFYHNFVRYNWKPHKLLTPKNLSSARLDGSHHKRDAVVELYDEKYDDEG